MRGLRLPRHPRILLHFQNNSCFLIFVMEALAPEQENIHQVMARYIHGNV
jgi:hypothetical protein